MKKLLLTASFATILLSASLSAQTVLSDSDFNGWTVWGYQSSWSSYSSTQDFTDGTPAPCHQATSYTTTTSGSQNIFHVGSSSLTWDPATMGAISDVTLDLQLSTQTWCYWSRARLSLEQGGQYYVSKNVWKLEGAPAGWHKVTPFINLREKDFAAHWGLNGTTGSWNPDFSAAGAPIRFGFYHEADWLQVGDPPVEFKIDNYNLTVRTPSDPPHLAVRTPRFDGIMKMSVTGLATGTYVQFGATLVGLGAGPCYPQWGGVCTDLLAPITFLGTEIVYPAANGLAFKEVRIPNTIAVGTSIYVQAIIVDGPGGATSYTTNTAEVSVSS